MAYGILGALGAANLGIAPWMVPGGEGMLYGTPTNSIPAPPKSPTVITPAPTSGQPAPSAPAPPPVPQQGLAGGPSGPALTAPPAGAPTGAPAAAPRPPQVTSTTSPQSPTQVDPLWSKVTQAESGNSPNAQSPSSSASGVGQITNGTWDDYVNSSSNGGKWTFADKNNPNAQVDAFNWRQGQIGSLYNDTFGRAPTDAEKLAGWMLGPAGATALSSNPDAPIGKTLAPLYGSNLDKVFAGNKGVLNPSMTGSQALSAIASFYDKSGGGAGTAPAAAQNTPPANSPSATLASAQSAMNDPDGSSAVGIPSQFNIPRATNADRLLAIASGFGGAPTVGMGIGRAAQALGQLRQNDMRNEITGQQLNNELARINMMDKFYGQRLGIQQQRADQGQGRLDNQTQALNDRYNPALISSNENEKVMAQRSAADQAALVSRIPEMQQNLTDITSMQGIIQQHPELLGSTWAARANQIAAMAGLRGGANDLDVLAKGSQEQKNQLISEMAAEHTGGVRSMAQAQMYGRALAEASTNPKAASWVLSQLANKQQHDLAWNDQLSALAKNGQTLSGTAYYNRLRDFSNAWYAAHPFQPWNGAVAPTASTAAPPAPAAPPQTATASAAPAPGASPSLNSFWK